MAQATRQSGASTGQTCIELSIGGTPLRRACGNPGTRISIDLEVSGEYLIEVSSGNNQTMGYALALYRIAIACNL